MRYETRSFLFKVCLITTMVNKSMARNLLILGSILLSTMVFADSSCTKGCSKGCEQPFAKPNSKQQKCSSDKCKVIVAPYLWSMNLNGAVNVGTRSVRVRQTFSDLFENMQGGGMLYVEEISATVLTLS